MRNTYWRMTRFLKGNLIFIVNSKSTDHIFLQYKPVKIFCQYSVAGKRTMLNFKYYLKRDVENHKNGVFFVIKKE